MTQVDDAGTFGGELSGSGTEDGGDITGTATFTDPADGYTAPNFELNTPATSGTAAINSAGDWTYTPDADFNGSDSFTIQVTDDDGNVETQVINLTVSQVNDAGTFGGDTSGTGDEDGVPIIGTLTFADAADGATTPNFRIEAGDGASDGVATINATTGAWSYDSDTNFNGSDSFTVSVTDDDGNVETQVIGLTVNQVDNPGAFGGDTSGTGPEDGAPIAGLLTFTDDLDGAASPNFRVEGGDEAVNGTASINASTGLWSYDSDLDFNGTDSFTVSVTDDDGNVETQVISLTVTQVDDPGTFGGDTSGSGPEDGGAVTGTLTFTDPADGFTTPDFTVTTPAGNGAASIVAGTGAWSYTPDADYNGTDSFIVTVTDDDGNTATQEIELTVTQVNDDGTFSGDTSGSGDEDGGAIAGTLTFTDTADGSSAPNYRVEPGDEASAGTATINASTGAWSYTPDANYNGTDSFTVSVTDDDGNVETQVIGLTVNQVDDPGTFTGDTSGSGPEDGGAIIGQLTFTDPADGSSAPNYRVEGIDEPANGTATVDSGTGDWSYTPDENYNGTDSFTVSVTDDDDNVETQLVSIAVTQVNDPGTFGGELSGIGAEDAGAITGTATFTDDIDGFTTPNFSIASAASDGTASVQATGEWSYTPSPDYNGSDSFTVQVTDDDGNVETQVIDLTVTEVNDSPVAAADSVRMREDEAALTILVSTLTANDVPGPANESSQLLTVIGVSPDAPATTTVGATVELGGGAVTYTPPPSFVGTDSFTYTVEDDGTTNGSEAFQQASATVNVARSGVIVTEIGDGTAVSETGPTSDTYTVVLAVEPTAPVTIAFSPDVQTVIDADDATPGNQSTLTFTSANWDAPRTVTVTAIDDEIIEEHYHNSVITHSVTSTDPVYENLPVVSVIVIVEDNDTKIIVETVSGYREFHWVEIAVAVDTLAAQAVMVSIYYGEHLDFLEDETDGVRVVAPPSRISVPTADDAGDGTQLVWDDDERARVMFFVVYNQSGATAVGEGKGNIVKIRFRVRRGAPIEELPLTLTDECMLLRPTSDGGAAMTFLPTHGSVTVDTQQAKGDLDENGGSASAWDGVWIYRAALLQHLGYGPIMTATMRAAHDTNLLSDDEMRANFARLAFDADGEGGAPAPLDFNGDGEVLASIEGVTVYKRMTGIDGTNAADFLVAEGADGETPLAGAPLEGQALARYDDSSSGRGDYIEVMYDEALYKDGTFGSRAGADDLISDGTTVVTSVVGTTSLDVTADCDFVMSATNRAILIYRKDIENAPFAAGETVTITINETQLEDVQGNVGAAAREVTVRIPKGTEAPPVNP